MSQLAQKCSKLSSRTYKRLQAKRSWSLLAHWTGLMDGAASLSSPPGIAQVKSFVAADPVVDNGEMVAEYHKFYGSAGLIMVNEVHNKLQKK
jgi:hypothetical protein